MWIRLCMKFEIHIIQEKLIKFRLRDGEKNASGNRPIVKRRNSWEEIQILKNYLSLETIDEFLKVFPEAEIHKSQITPKLIPYFVSVLALKRKKHSYTIFAVNAIFDLLNNPETTKLLEEKCNFTYIDLINLTGKYNVSNVVSHKKQGKPEKAVKKKRFFII